MSNKYPEQQRLIPERIRNLRESRGLAAYALAKKIGISPSYLSLIESGRKLPSEEIAMKIATALGDDPELYRAWVRAAQYGNTWDHLHSLNRLQRYVSTPELRRRLRGGEQIEDRGEEGPSESPAEQSEGIESSASRRARWAQRTARDRIEPSKPDNLTEPGAATQEVPLLREGADPEDPSATEDRIDTLQLDPRMLPPGAHELFAYRPEGEMLEQVGGLIRPGDLVVLSARPERFDASAIYAVRDGRDVILSRLMMYSGDVLMLPADDSKSPRPISGRTGGDWSSAVVGVVVTTIRSWSSGESLADSVTHPRSPARGMPPGRTSWIEGDFLVRDCEWRERYGWRPIQRPEEMDYLDAHPGMRMRFRLLRDGSVKYLLEMTPEEWREALGRYGKGRSWLRNGYVVAITKRKRGEYGEEFQGRWQRLVRLAD